MDPTFIYASMMATNTLFHHNTTTKSPNIDTTNSNNNAKTLLLTKKRGKTMTLNKNEKITMYRIINTDFQYHDKWEVRDNNNKTLHETDSYVKCFEFLNANVKPIEIEVIPTVVNSRNDGRFSYVNVFLIMAKVPDMEAINHEKEIMEQAKKMAQNIPNWENCWY